MLYIEMNFFKIEILDRKFLNCRRICIKSYQKVNIKKQTFLVEYFWWRRDKICKILLRFEYFLIKKL